MDVLPADGLSGGEQHGHGCDTIERVSSPLLKMAQPVPVVGRRGGAAEEESEVPRRPLAWCSDDTVKLIFKSAQSCEPGLPIR
jgi:hypothetical protein